MFTCLWHRAIGSGNNNYCAIHLSCTSYHIFNIVSMSRTVNMCIMTFGCLIFNMSGINCYTSFFFFRSIVD